MKWQLVDYGFDFQNIPIWCDNTSAINLIKKPIQHSRTEHIKIRQRFICDHVNNGDVILKFVPINEQLADIFTKPIDCERFQFIKMNLKFAIPLSKVLRQIMRNLLCRS